MGHFHSYGGRVDQTAIIGHAPEHKDWDPTQPIWHPDLGEGVRIEAFVSVDAGTERHTTIGPRTWLLKHAHIGHDALIGADVTIATGAIIGGHATIGDNACIGLGAIILPFRQVGADATIGAGSVVTNNVPAGETWAGNPARPLPEHHRDARPLSERVKAAVRELAA